MKKVTIMYRNSFFGGDGWTYYPKTIWIDEYCPICGCERAEPSRTNICEDGDWYNVDTWRNDCGHIDTYKQCYLEYLELIKQGKVID